MFFARRARKWLFIVIIGLVAAEVALRVYGFGQPLLYEKTKYGYRVKPSQDIKRFGNRLYYNRQGLRSGEIDGASGPQRRVLCLGDSITYGGVQADQTQTYPELLASMLSNEGQQVSVLNASAGGWALANEWGWLQENGFFGSQVLLLEIGLNDLMQPKAGTAVVDKHPSFPGRNPMFALQEVVYRYLLPRLGLIKSEDPGAQALDGTQEQVVINMGIVREMVEYARARRVDVVILRIEEPAFSREEKYIRAGLLLDDLAKNLGVRVIKPDAALKQADYKKVFHADMVHPNAVGNKVIAGVISEALTPMQPAR